jgi:type IV secretory pathway TraG/TraD family ATPase VirD4
MIRDELWPRLLAAIIGVVGLANLLMGFIAQTVTAAICGSRPEPATAFSGVWLALSGDLTAYETEACALPILPIRVLDAVAAIIMVGVCVAAVLAWMRYRQSDAAFIGELRRRPGFATAAEIRAHLSARAVRARGAILRPGATQVSAEDVGWRVGRSRGLDVFVSIEDSVALEGPPRSGKGYRVLISAILDWAGPLITTSTTNDNVTATLRMRQRRGQVHVFDPQQLSGIRHTLRIDPIVGCEDPLVAVQRGTAIVTGTALGASASNQEWAAAASTVLSRLLHAAAIGGRDVTALHEWGSTPAVARTAVDILRADGAPGWGDGLEAVLIGDEKLLSSTWFGVQGAVAPLAIPQIREALRPDLAIGPTFEPDEFLNDHSTLYLLGSGSGAGAMGGFLAAVLDDVVEVARRKALASPGGRLAEPLGLILDEIVNMFRWASLPRIMADGGGRGICTFVVLQALSQAETAWSRAEADTIWSAATAKILLGGAGHVGHLRDVEALLGWRERLRRQRSWDTRRDGYHTSELTERLPLMTADEIRRLPAAAGLLTYRNRRGVLLDLTGWDQRADADAIRTTRRDTEEEQRTQFASQLRTPRPPADGPGSDG